MKEYINAIKNCLNFEGRANMRPLQKEVSKSPC